MTVSAAIVCGGLCSMASQKYLESKLATSSSLSLSDSSTPFHAASTCSSNCAAAHPSGGEDELSAKISRIMQDGVLMSSGAITGEAIIGILLAIPIVISGDVNVLAVGWVFPLEWLGAVWLLAYSMTLFLVPVWNVTNGSKKS